MGVETITVKVTDDYMAKVQRSKAEDAIAELIWNALDADATEVSVTFPPSTAQLVSTEKKIVIKDNGTSIPWDKREELFGQLGHSWKKLKPMTDGGRETHGSEGHGRFKSFALGQQVTWSVVYEKDNQRIGYEIFGRSDHPTAFDFTEPVLSKTKKTGVAVEIDNLTKSFSFLDESSLLMQKIAPMFSLYINTYPGISLSIDGDLVDPSTYITRNDFEIDLDNIVYEGKSYPFKLKIVEWDLDAIGRQKSIMLCDQGLFPLQEYDKQVRNIGDYSYTAYLSSDAFREMHHKNLLSLGELGQDLSKAVDEAIKSIKAYFSSRKIEDNQTIFDSWKSEGIYPYKSDELLRIETGKASVVETAERELFDILALTLRDKLPNFDANAAVAKKFQLHMLKQAVESGESALKKIIGEILQLSDSERDSLVHLFEESSLSSVIKTASEISNRIKFIEGLDEIVYNKAISKHMKERSQLHKILADNTWVFGEQFTLSVNDQALTEVLRSFLSSQKDTEIIVDEPVLRIDGTKGIVDLMLTRSLGHVHPDESHYLVVELKAPDVHIGKKQCRQVEDYMLAVTNDPRFKGGQSRWEFWIVGDDYASDGYVKTTAKDSYGLIDKNSVDGISYEIRAVRWSTLLDNAKHRLEFLKKQLNLDVSKNDSLRYLKETYAQYTEAIVIE